MANVAPARAARVLAIAEVSIEADAVGEAALSADWDANGDGGS